VLKDLFALTKPRLNFLVLLSALAGYEMGRSGPFDLFKMLEFAAALFLLAGGSSALNMWVEREQDARMKRTASRPLAAGRISPQAGLIFGLLLSILSLTWLTLRINPLTAWLGGLTWASYLFVYTPLKRVSSLSTLV
jgi:protoheme IX farnesyltransferase